MHIVEGRYWSVDQTIDGKGYWVSRRLRDQDGLWAKAWQGVWLFPNLSEALRRLWEVTLHRFF